MSAKKTLTAIVLSAGIMVASPFALAQKKQKPKFRFNLKPQEHHLKYEFKKGFSIFDNLQERMCRTGRDYAIVQAPGDNMPIIVPNMRKYEMRIIRPRPGWYGDDKFVIPPAPMWRTPRFSVPRGVYRHYDGHQGMLLYERKFCKV